MMPGEYTAESLPAPDDDRIAIEEVAGHRLAALPYRGRWSEDLHDRSLQQLRRVLSEEGLSADGEPIWARYDPPWKPWFLRRNEVLLQLAD